MFQLLLEDLHLDFLDLTGIDLAGDDLIYHLVGVLVVQDIVSFGDLLEFAKEVLLLLGIHSSELLTRGLELLDIDFLAFVKLIDVG